MDTKKLRQKILDLAIRGKLVPQDPNDEPASVLLERIRAEKELLIKEGKIKRSKKSAASDTSHYENVPFEVPESWEWVNIMEILLKLTDGTHHSPKNYPKGNYKYITAKNIKNEGIVLDDVTYVDDETHHKIFSRCNPEYGDILYIKDGATTGVVAINNLTEDFSLLSSVALLKPSKLVSNKYLFYYLQSSYCYESVRSSMKGVGITRITLKQIVDWDVPIPPIGEQHRIVEYIDSLFSQIDLIAKDTSILKSFLEKYKHGILDLAIAGKLVPQDPSEEPAVELLMRINPTYKSCDNRHYENLPDSWEEVELGDVCQLFDGEKVRGKEFINLDVKYLRGSKDGSRLSSGKYVPENALMILVDGENSGEVFTTPHEGYQGSTFMQLRISSELNRDYVLLLIQRSRELLKDNKVGSAIPHLNKKLFKQIHVPIPPYDEQSRIVRVVQDAMNKLDEILADL